MAKKTMQRAVLFGLAVALLVSAASAAKDESGGKNTGRPEWAGANETEDYGGPGSQNGASERQQDRNLTGNTSQERSKEADRNQSRKQLRMGLKQGWNLVALPGEGNLSSGDCAEVGALYGLVYMRDNGTYATMNRASAAMGERDLKHYLAMNAFWVYSFRDCAMVFGLYNATSFAGMALDEGWNFLPVTEDMAGKSLKDIGAECDFHKAYYWDAEKQGWRELGMGEKFASGMLYTGFAVKTDLACVLGESAPGKDAGGQDETDDAYAEDMNE